MVVYGLRNNWEFIERKEKEKEKEKIKIKIKIKILSVGLIELNLHQMHPKKQNVVLQLLFTMVAAQSS